MYSKVKIYDFSYWAKKKVYILLSPYLSGLSIPCLLAIRGRNSSWACLSLKENLSDCEIQGRSEQAYHKKSDDTLGPQEPVERLKCGQHTLSLSSLKLTLFSLVSDRLSPCDNKPGLQYFPGFTSYFICPWKKTNFDSLEHKFFEKILNEEEAYWYRVGQLPILI